MRTKTRVWIPGTVALAMVLVASAIAVALPRRADGSATPGRAAATTAPSAGSSADPDVSASVTPATSSRPDDSIVPRLAVAATAAGSSGTLGSTTFTTPALSTDPALTTLRLVNYYPAYHGWSRMWFEWDPQAIQADFADIRAMGANAVRLILHVDVFGYPTPSSTMMGRLSQAISMADAQGLRVQLTLFDNWNSYKDLAGSKQWANAILRPRLGDRRIAFVEVKNELDPTDAHAMAWARSMIPHVRSAAGRPVAASARVFGPDPSYGFRQLIEALGGATRPDIFSYHYYGSYADAPYYFAVARDLASPTPIFIGETGFADATSPSDPVDPDREAAQAYYLYRVEVAAAELDLPAAAPWTFRDFAPGTLDPASPGYEYRMGLVRLDGSKKPSYDALQIVFGWFVEKYGDSEG